MIEYPYTTPQILNDDAFLLYGADMGTSTNPQRQVAYLLAEMQMTYHLDSFLLPTIVTGTYFYKGANPINLEFGNIISILSVGIQSVNGSSGCNIDTVSGCYAVRGDGKYGYLDVQYLLNCGGCSGVVSPPYNIQVAYQSGLHTGTSSMPQILGALVLAAQINLNEMDVSLSNEGTADIGIQSFVNQKYSEIRVKKLGSTAFGNSPNAVRVARLVKRYRTKPSIGFH